MDQHRVLNEALAPTNEGSITISGSLSVEAQLIVWDLATPYRESFSWFRRSSIAGRLGEARERAVGHPISIAACYSMSGELEVASRLSYCLYLSASTATVAGDCRLKVGDDTM